MCLLNVEHCLETSSNWVTNEAIVFVVSNKPVAAKKYDDHSRDNWKSKRLEAKLDCFSWSQSCFPTPQQVRHFKRWRVIHSFGFCLNYGDLYQVFVILCLLIILINQTWFHTWKGGNLGSNWGIHCPHCCSSCSRGLAFTAANSRQRRDDDLEIGQTTT